MTTKWKVSRLVALLSTLFWAQTSASQSSPGDLEPRISVRISAAKSHFQPGEDIPVHVEIWNVGKQDVFIFKDIQADFYNGLAFLDLILHHGNQVVGPIARTASDCFCSERSSYPPLVGELPKYWIPVPPQHFYGGEVVMHAYLFPSLKIPGKYRIQGKYSSLGFLAENINNPLMHYAKELKELPYTAWVGEAETNSVWVEITNRDRRPIHGNSAAR